MTTLADADEVHPAAFVAVKLYEPVTNIDKVVLALVPVTAPGLIVQLPIGKPLNTTLAVATVHVG